MSALVVAVVLVTLAGLGGLAWAYNLALHERDLAWDEKQRADDSEQKALLQKKRAEDNAAKEATKPPRRPGSRQRSGQPVPRACEPDGERLG